jgi:hypothetical protein
MRAARDKGGVLSSPCSQTRGLAIGLARRYYVIRDITAMPPNPALQATVTSGLRPPVPAAEHTRWA